MTAAPITRASRAARASEVEALDQARNAQLSLKQVWPYIEKYAAQYKVDPKVLAGIINQESGFKNYGVHFDGTGHGLVGLDDNGLLPDFESWSGKKFGRGAGAKKIGGVDPKDEGPATGSGAFDIARAQLGKNAGSLKLEKTKLGRAMEDWVPNNVNCASFVGGCMEAAGQINHGDYSAGCTTLMANLDRNSKFKRVSLANARVGDCVTFKTPGGHHTVMFAGMKNGQPQFIGSNNVNSDGSQRITMGGMNYQLLAVHHYVG